MKALIMIDPQNDFCTGGALAVPGGEEVVPLLNRLAASFDAIVITQDWHPAGHSSFADEHAGREPLETVKMPYGDQILWPTHCVIGSKGAEFHPALRATVAQLIVRKGFRKEIDSYSAFFENDHRTPTGLDGYLKDRSIKQLALGGLAYDFCVFWSARDARKLGYEVTVITDACRAIDVEGSRANAETEMREAGCLLKSSDEVMASM